VEALFGRSQAGTVIGHHTQDFIELAVDRIEPLVEVSAQLSEPCGHFRQERFLRLRDAAVVSLTSQHVRFY
jgi:hypothetical protein